MTRLALALVFSCITAASAAAQITKPVRYTWVATSIDNWNDAAAALILAGGDGNVIAIPTGNASHPWLLLRRVEEGSIYIPDDEPRVCNVFATVTEASSHYLAIDGCHGPLLLSAPDGRLLVVALRECDDDAVRRRSVRR